MDGDSDGGGEFTAVKSLVGESGIAFETSHRHEGERSVRVKQECALPGSWSIHQKSGKCIPVWIIIID